MDDKLSERPDEVWKLLQSLQHSKDERVSAFRETAEYEDVIKILLDLV